MSEAQLYMLRVWRQAGAFRVALQAVGSDAVLLLTDPADLAAHLERLSCGGQLAPLRAMPAAVNGHAPRTEALSPRQRDIATRYASGDSHRQIAQTLGLAPATVRNHLSHIYDKLQVRHRAGLIAALALQATPAGPHDQAGRQGGPHV